MRPPPPPPPPRRGPAPPPPKDTLDDIDLHLDAVHEKTEPFDALREAPTDIDPGARPAVDPRELPTGPAEQRTAPWMRTGILGRPGAGPERATDPWFWPLVVFVAVLVGFIAVFVYQETHKVR